MSTVATPDAEKVAGQVATDTVSPTGPSPSRIGSLDFIRGLAVMGILAANIVAFGQPFNAYTYPDAFLTEHGPAEDWMYVIQLTLIDGKMRALFTMLFGAGMYLFMEKAWAKGHTRRLQARRLFWLLVFGLIHFFFIWMGDILTYYALIGFVALACVGWSAKRQLKVGILGYIAGGILYGAMMTMPWAVADTSFGDDAMWEEMRTDLDVGIAEAMEDDRIDTGLIQSGDYAGYVTHRLTEDWWEPIGNTFFFAMETLPLMLIGMALYRYGFFSGAFDPGKMRKWGWIGLLGGGAITLAIGLWAKAGGLTFYGSLAAMMGWSVLPRLVMALGLAALLVVWSASATGWFAERVSAAGRAAFTNYLGTSILMLFVFHGWAGGLFGELTRGQLYLVMLATWILMLLWSKPWLDRYRYGPLEWLWRCLTYGRLFPLRR